MVQQSYRIIIKRNSACNLCGLWKQSWWESRMFQNIRSLLFLHSFHLPCEGWSTEVREEEDTWHILLICACLGTRPLPSLQPQRFLLTRTHKVKCRRLVPHLTLVLGSRQLTWRKFYRVVSPVCLSFPCKRFSVYLIFFLWCLLWSEMLHNVAHFFGCWS